MTAVTERTERLILNPSEVAASGFPEVNLHDGAIRVTEEGPDWGDQEVEMFVAEGLFGSRPIDLEWPMRVVTIPLILGLSGSYDAARITLAAVVSQIDLEGGWLKREIIGGDYGEAGKALYCDVTKATLKLGHGTPQVVNAIDPNAELVLECLPDLYGDIVTEELGEGTGDLADTIQVRGDMPARVEAIKVEDLSGHDQKGLMWHVRRRNYSDASTAAWAYDAEDLTPLDIAEKLVVEADTYGTKVVQHPDLSHDWTPVLSTGVLTHTGLYDVWARTNTNSSTIWLRLLYGVGDVIAPQENVQVQLPWSGTLDFSMVYLGQVNIGALPFGDQRWEGVIQARGESSATEQVRIDRLWFQCADEGSGVLGALESSTALSSITASDSLSGEVRALKGSEALRGGEWEESGGEGGFTRGEVGAEREAKEDSEGRTALLSDSKVGAVCAKVERFASAEGALGGLELWRGLYLRYVSSTIWVRVTVKTVQSGSHTSTKDTVALEYDEGTGVKTVILDDQVRLPFYVAPVEPSQAPLEAQIDDSGAVVVRVGGKTYRTAAPASFAKGGTHAEGKVGIYDYNSSAVAVTRTYRYFVANPLPPSDAVVYAERAAYLSTKGMYRQSEDGEGVGPIGRPGSDLPRLPVSGPAETPVEIAVKPSRGRLGELADPAKDEFKVQVSYRPCYASIPES